jgi:hypothetical protein
MSQVKITGNASGTGIFTIASPNSNNNQTLTLPDSTGTVQVSGNPISGTTGTFTGLLDISAAGAGQIQFPATQNASANANTLDDYEEGTFTPTITAASGSNGGVTATGSYTKVGRFVFLQLALASISKGTLSGQLAVGGLPFTVTIPNSTATCRWDLGGGTPPSGMTLICPQSGGGTGLELQAFGASGYLGNLSAVHFGSTFNIYNITFCYQTT